MRKKLLKKLSITKETVANLSNVDMNYLKGGILTIACPTATNCEGRPCMTAAEYCSIDPTCAETGPIACP